MSDINIKEMVLRIILIIVAFIIIFSIVGLTAPDLISASDNITAGTNISGVVRTLPLSNLFSATGVLNLVLMVAIFIGLLFLVFKDEFK